tara:strand:+ start:875 stop:1555 length:681 start_codon:yes stop_codon:yes gene_type:complete
MHPQTDRKNKLILYIILLFFLSTINNKSINLKSSSFLKINEIKVSGLSDLENLKVKDELKSIIYHNLFLIDRKIILKSLSNNNLIESFIIKKIYPNLILVDLKKTEFIGVTRKSNKFFFVGSNGKLIKYKENNLNLPFVFGNFKNSELLDFKKIIDKSNMKFENVESIYFFPSNRWDIKTKDGILIKLPEKNLHKKLNLASKIINSEEFIENKIIDLRITNYIITK